MDKIYKYTLKQNKNERLLDATLNNFNIDIRITLFHHIFYDSLIEEVSISIISIHKSL